LPTANYEIVPIVSGETEKRSKVNQAKKDHAKKVREEMIAKATPSYVEVCQPGLGTTRTQANRLAEQLAR
jgi:hypothetical protein